MPHTPGHEEEGFRLPFQSQFLPQEFQQAQFDVFDQMLKRIEKNQLEGLMEEQEERGFLKSGRTDKRIIEEILGPSIQRRREFLTPLAAEGARMGREERLGEVGFQRQRQFAGEEFQRKREFAGEDFMRKLDFLRQRHQFERELMELKDDLEGGFGEAFMGSFGSGLAGLATSAISGGAKKIGSALI